MRVVLTLDYELYFGARSGTAERCVLEPTRALLDTFSRHGVKACWFVDAGYIWRMSVDRSQYRSVEREYEAVARQVADLRKAGHEIGLHVHPHWEDSYWSDGGWSMDTTRYRLADFERPGVAELLTRYKESLETIVGESVTAYRAGGWCIQPFEHIAGALFECGIRVDSSVFRGGFVHTASRYFDFRSAENKTVWRFENDPVREDTAGRFLEIPISSLEVSPLFYWQLAAMRALRINQQTTYGDGTSKSMGREHYWKLMLASSHMAVSLDGWKASLLERGMRTYRNSFGDRDYFVTIGHPKATTRRSLIMIEKFITARRRSDHFTTFRDERAVGAFA